MNADGRSDGLGLEPDGSLLLRGYVYGIGRRQGVAVSGFGFTAGVNRFESHATVRRNAGLIRLVGRVHRVLIIDNAATRLDIALDRSSSGRPHARQEKSPRKQNCEY